MKSYLNLQVSCKIEYNIISDDENEAYFDLSNFLCDLNDCPELIELLEVGESVNTHNFDLVPSENDYNSIEIKKSGSTESSPFCLSLDDMRAVTEILSHYDQTRRTLEIGVEHGQPVTTADTRGQFNKVFKSEFVGHAYQNLDKTDSDVEFIHSSLDFAMFSLANYNNYNKLKDRHSSFEKISLPHLERRNRCDEDCRPKKVEVEASNKTDLELTKNRIEEEIQPESIPNDNDISAELFKEPAMFQGVTVSSAKASELDYTADSEDANAAESSICLVDSVNQPSNVSSVSSMSFETSTVRVDTIAPNVDEVCNTISPSLDDIPSENLEVIGDLQNYLRTKGAFDSIQYHSTTSRNPYGLPAFSFTLTFKIDSSEYEFKTSRTFPKKADAKKSVAYLACKALNIYDGVKQSSSDQAESTIVPQVSTSPHGGSISPAESSSHQEKDEIPPKHFNVVGDLQEHLQKTGSLHTLNMRDVGVGLFKYSLSFKIDNSEYKFESLQEYPNKKEAKRRTFYIACKSLKLYKT